MRERVCVRALKCLLKERKGKAQEHWSHFRTLALAMAVTEAMLISR